MKKLIYLSILLIVGACTEEPTNNDNPIVEVKDTVPVVTVPTPDFNQDSAYYFIQKQVDFGPRVPNTKSHENCAIWLEDKLKEFQFSTIVQTGTVKAWNGEILNIKNIIGQHKPEATERIMLCAHWDSRPYADKDTINQYKPIDGANDGASGVGVLLEIARQISLLSPEYGVDIIFFDAEDYGTFENKNYQDIKSMYNDWCLGSQYWATNPPIANYKPKYGILLDMVGAANATFPKEGVSMQFAATHVNNLWNAAEQLGYGNYFVKKIVGGITDDHTFINQMTGIPTLDIIHMNTDSNYSLFGAFHHTHGDNMTVIDKNTLKAVGQTVLYAIYQKI
jgi:hypothetical protein